MKQSLREKKKHITNEAIFKAAMELFLENGFDNTTIDQIADKAVVARRTFFRYFKSKEDLLVNCMDQQLECLLEQLKQRLLSENPYEAIENVFYNLADLYMIDLINTKALLKLMYETPSIRVFRLEKCERWEEAFSKEINNIINPKEKIDIRSRLLAARAVDAFIISIDFWYKDNFKSDVKKILKHAFKIAREEI